MFLKIFRDNPLIMRHIRSRLRTKQLLPAVIIVTLIAACITWAGLSPSDEASFSTSKAMTALPWLVLCQAFILLLIGSTQVAGSIALARETGVMDFHRTSPQKPLALVLGFLLGAPIREYLLYACTLPFVGLFQSHAELQPFSLFFMQITLLGLALMYHIFAMLFGLVAPKPRNSGALFVLLIVIIHLVSLFSITTQFAMTGYLTIVPCYMEYISSVMNNEIIGMLAGRYTFFNGALPAWLITMFHVVTLLGFFTLAAIRKMRHERTLSFSKPIAVLFFAVLTTLFIGDSMGFGRSPGSSSDNFAVSFLLYSLTLIALILVGNITPGYGDVLKGLRQAAKAQKKRLAIWGEVSTNHAPVICIGLILFIGGCITSFACNTAATEFLWIIRGCVASGLAAGTVIYFGLLKQAFDVIFRKTSTTYLMLVIFGLWLLPLLLSLAVAIAISDESISEFLVYLTPISSIGVTAMTEPPNDIMHLGVNAGIILTLLVVIFAFYLYFIALKRARAKVQLSNMDEEKIPIMPTPLEVH